FKIVESEGGDNGLTLTCTQHAGHKLPETVTLTIKVNQD
ncbi:MAG: hypothetical protein ACI909_002769, partial [Planctomycetota bacterium]